MTSAARESSTIVSTHTSEADHIRENGYYARGRFFTPKQVGVISELVERYAHEGRTSISRRICRALRWRQPNGDLKDMACREVLRKLDELRVIELPEPMSGGGKWIRVVTHEEIEEQPCITKLDFSNIEIECLGSKRDSKVLHWNSMVEQFHYLHTSRIVGRQLKYLFSYEGQTIACLGWGDCAWAQSARDNWIGWTDIQRKRNRKLVVNNCRFLILPHVKVPNLASWILARCTAAVIRDWSERYCVKPILLETFVDSDRFAGTCYKAANWTEVGTTQGFAKAGNAHQRTQSTKFVFAYPVCRKFRTRLRGR